MKLTRRTETGTWYVDFKDNQGRRRRVSCGTNDRAEALQKAPAIIAKTNKQTTTSDHGEFYTVGMALNQAWEEKWQYQKSAQTKLPELQIVSAYWKDTPVGAVTTKACKEWAQKMKTAGLKPSTINKRISTLSMALKVAVENDELENVPYLPRMSEKNIAPRSVSVEEEQLLKREALALNDIVGRPQGGGAPGYPGTGDIMVNVIEALIQTGMRVSELLRAQPQNVRGDHLLLPEQKSGKPGVVVLTPEAKDALEFLWNHPSWKRVTDGVVNHQGVINSRRLTAARDWCVKRFTTIRNRAGLRDVSIHKLRHTTATRLIDANVPQAKVQRIMRHSGPAVTQRYIDLKAEDLLDDVMVLSRRNPSHRRELDNVVALDTRRHA